MSFEPVNSYFDDDEDAFPLPLPDDVVIANWKTASAAASPNWSSATGLGLEMSSHARW